MNTRTLLEYALGPVISMLLGLATIPLLSWFYPAEAVAANALMVTVIAVLPMVLTLGMDQYFVRQYHFEQPGRVLGLTLSAALVFTTVALCAYHWLLPFGLSQWLLGEAVLRIEVLVSLCALATVINKFLLNQLRMNERSLHYSAAQAVLKISILGGIVFGIVYGGASAKTLVSTALCAPLVVFVYLVIVTAKYSPLLPQPNFKLSEFKVALSYGIPLLFSTVGVWALSGIDRIMLDSLSSKQQLATYAIAFNFATVASIVQAVFSSVWAPHVFKTLKQGGNTDLYQSVFDNVLLLVVALVAMVGVCGWILDYLLPDSYHQVKIILACCCLVPLLNTLGAVSMVAVQVSKKTYKITAITLSALGCNILLNYPLISNFGANGAAVGSMLAAAFYCVAMFVAGRNEGANIKLSLKHLKLPIVLAFTVLMALQWVSTKTVVVFFAAVLLVLLIENRQHIAPTLSYLRRKVNP